VQSEQFTPRAARRGPSILVPEPEPEHPEPHRLRSAAFVVGAGYAVLVVALLAIGWLLRHPLDASVGKWDASVNRWLADRRTPFWNDITGTATWFVNTVPAIGIAAVMTITLSFMRRFREAAMIVLALVLELLVFLSVTYIVARPRPDVVRLDQTPATGSFPSGHTAAATVLFAGLAIVVCCCTTKTGLRVASFVFAVAVATLVGFGRVYRGLHHPTDVAAGALLGASCLVVAVLAVRRTARTTPPRTSSESDASPARRSAA